eukprot:m.490009 g.490009  ORF g.490009 m.490009 type:complete len:63 (-) comp27350_c0_seq1:14-202(-)
MSGCIKGMSDSVMLALSVSVLAGLESAAAGFDIAFDFFFLFLRGMAAQRQSCTQSSEQIMHQ